MPAARPGAYPHASASFFNTALSVGHSRFRLARNQRQDYRNQRASAWLGYKLQGPSQMRYALLHPWIVLDGPCHPGERVYQLVKPLHIRTLLRLFPAKLEQIQGPVLPSLECEVERKDEARDGSPPRRGHSG